jgi:hypothetical protein
MPTPSIRNPIRPARGNYSDLLTNVADLYEGELCYAIDQDLMYIVEQGTLQAVNSSSIAGSSALITNITNAQHGESLNYDGANWVNGGVQDGGNF